MKGKKRELWMVVVMTLLSLVSVSVANEYYVDPVTGDDAGDGSEPFPKRTVQAAIDLSENGDTIFLADGIYAGAGNRDLVLDGLTITIESLNGPEDCVIDCEGSSQESHYGFSVFCDVVLDGLTITNGYSLGGGAIYIEDAGPEIRNCVIHSNESLGKGGGIFCSGGSPVFRDCEICDNVAYDGGGLYLCQQSQVEMTGCVIQGNKSIGGIPTNGGGINVQEESELYLRDCRILGNQSDTWGGGLYLEESEFLAVNCLMTGNWAGSYGGAVYAKDSPAAVLVNCTVSDNEAVYLGGAIRGCQSDMAIVNSIFYHDSVLDISSGSGPEIALTQESDLTVSYSDVQGGVSRISLEAGCVLTWTQDALGQDTNLDVDPLFAGRGSWDDNQTIEEPTDDFWQEGDYRLQGNSACINVGLNSAVTSYAQTDLEGLDRMVFEAVDLGAFESGLVISRCMVKAGRDRQEPADSFIIMGELDVSEQDFQQDQMILRIPLVGDDYEEEFDLRDTELFTKNARKPLYIYKRKFEKGSGGVTMMKFDLDRGTFLIRGQNMDLSGLANPVDLSLQWGDLFLYGLAGEDLINNRKPIPIQLMSGVADTLAVYKSQFRPSEKADSDMLQIIGGIALEDWQRDLTGVEVTVSWGTFEAVIPAGAQGLIQKGTKFLYKKPKDLVNGSTIYLDNVQIDPERGQFRIQVKKVSIGDQPNPASFRVQWDGFDQFCDVPY